ncbi:hypothetical protein Nepgr_024742 [Nepenthes gracilis]|uniref:Uncharacterized protein n=1 Tax=Nepenthes gracilis TaxID=150966 RepID=A0AAD3T506_NEPGR|nr:hypothetical protein Nepgr_024742 [Nepenthes gracilis]
MEPNCWLFAGYVWRWPVCWASSTGAARLIVHPDVISVECSGDDAEWTLSLVQLLLWLELVRLRGICCVALYVADDGKAVHVLGFRLLCYCVGMRRAGRPCC